MNVTRRLGKVAAVGATTLTVLAMSACTDSADNGRERFEAVEADATGAVDGLVHDLADELDVEFEAGTRDAVICGESYAPRGLNLRVFARLSQPPEVTPGEAMVIAVRLLKDDGWTLQPDPRDTVVVATRDDLTIRLEFPGWVQAEISAGCIETDDDTARDVADDPVEDLVWE